MSEAMKVIVANYVRLGKVDALNELRRHRAKLLTDIRFNNSTAFDAGFITEILEAEIDIVEAGLAALAAQSPGQDKG